MKDRVADEGNWQARGQTFAVGQSVRLIQGGPTDEGRVIAVWPGIGMVDVQWPHTSYRHPVEDLLINNPGQDPFIAPIHESVPGEAGVGALVSTGKPQTDNLIPMISPLVQEVKLEDKLGSLKELAQRVAKVYVKKAIYWNGLDRKYRCTRVEGATGHYKCPKTSCNGTLKPAVYKREDQSSVKLLGCPKCLFLIRRQDIIDATNCDEEEVV